MIKGSCTSAKSGFLYDQPWFGITIIVIIVIIIIVVIHSYVFW
jgi:hypothetical protein